MISLTLIVAREILAQGPLHVFYAHFVKVEWAALMTTLGRAPDSVAILGSGALPETGIWVTEWARTNGLKVHIHNVEFVPSRLEQSIKVYKALGALENATFEAGDVRITPKDLGAFDAVYFNATVGSTAIEKESIMLDVVGRMRRGAFMVTRSTYSLKTMAYPVSSKRSSLLENVSLTHSVPIKAVSIQSQRIISRLKPVLTCHMNGEAGSSINSTVIISRVL
jgi:nicotianamine synthase